MMWKLFFALAYFIHFTISQNCQLIPLGQTGQNNQNGPMVSEIMGKKLSLAVWPVWDDETQSLYFLDFLATSSQPGIYRYSYADGMLYSAAIPGADTLGFIYPVRQGCKECTDLFAVGSGHDVIFVRWDGRSPQAQVVGSKLFTVEPNVPLAHINIAVADRHGRIYEGPFSLDFCNTAANNSLYRYTNNKGLQRIFTGVIATTGIAFDEKAHKMYHLDGCSLLLTSFDYDPKTGDLCNGQVVFDFKALGKSIDSFVPIGMTIDSKGMLYFGDYNSLCLSTTQHDYRHSHHRHRHVQNFRRLLP